MPRRIRDLGFRPGRLPSGAQNAITDVAGLAVGHCSLVEGAVRTGVTAVLPHGGNLFRQKLPAGLRVFNGFGKSAGLMQLQELGAVETPIVLTNTLAVGTAFTVLVEEALAACPEIGRATGTVNPLVLECNDGLLSDIRALAVGPEHVRAALAAARERPGAAPQEGAVGAGSGMCCYGLAGGIGNASRIAVTGGERFTVGALTLNNFGRIEELRVDGQRLGEVWAPLLPEDPPERGSVVTIIATDAPLTSRQLGRLAGRAAAGLARTGSTVAGGSGELAVAFSTAEPLPHESGRPVAVRRSLHEALLDPLFAAVVEATEEAVLNALAAAGEVTGRDGRRRCAFADLLREQAPGTGARGRP
jgi:D-aminopeptidase